MGQLATTFTTQEVNALLEFHRLALRSASDAQAYATKKQLLGLVRKFQRMADKAHAQEGASRGAGT